MTDRDLIAEGRALFELAVMPEQPVMVYDANDDGFHPLSQWVIGNDPGLIADEDAEESVLNLIVDIGDAGDARWIAWLINNGEVLLDELEGLHVQLGRLKQAVESDFAAIAAKQQRDRERIDKALRLIDQHAGYALAALVRNTLEGNANE
jgi:hypothetical protein